LQVGVLTITEKQPLLADADDVAAQDEHRSTWHPWTPNHTWSRAAHVVTTAARQQCQGPGFGTSAAHDPGPRTISIVKASYAGLEQHGSRHRRAPAVAHQRRSGGFRIPVPPYV